MNRDLKGIPTSVLLDEIKNRELEDKNSEYLTADDLRKLYGYKSYQSIYRRIKEDGERDKKYIVKRTTGKYGNILIDKKSFMEFWNGGESND